MGRMKYQRDLYDKPKKISLNIPPLYGRFFFSAAAHRTVFPTGVLHFCLVTPGANRT